MNLKFRIKIYLKYIIINLLSLIGAIFTFFLFRLCSVKTIISVVRNISSFIVRNFRRRLHFGSVVFLSRRMNRFLSVDSCFKICVSQKIVLSILGYDVEVVCAVKSSIEESFEGHAWITYNNEPILEENETIDNYVKSFTI